MKGYLYQLKGDGGFEELYWSNKELDNIEGEYISYFESDEYEEIDFEEYYTQRNDSYLERVFVDEIYV